MLPAEPQVQRDLTRDEDDEGLLSCRSSSSSSSLVGPSGVQSPPHLLQTLRKPRANTHYSELPATGGAPPHAGTTMREAQIHRHRYPRSATPLEEEHSQSVVAEKEKEKEKALQLPPCGSGRQPVTPPLTLFTMPALQQLATHVRTSPTGAAAPPGQGPWGAWTGVPNKREPLDGGAGMSVQSSVSSPSLTRRNTSASQRSCSVTFLQMPEVAPPALLTHQTLAPAAPVNSGVPLASILSTPTIDSDRGMRPGGNLFRLPSPLPQLRLPSLPSLSASDASEPFPLKKPKKKRIPHHHHHQHHRDVEPIESKSKEEDRSEPDEELEEVEEEEEEEMEEVEESSRRGSHRLSHAATTSHYNRRRPREEEKEEDTEHPIKLPLTARPSGGCGSSKTDSSSPHLAAFAETCRPFRTPTPSLASSLSPVCTHRRSQEEIRDGDFERLEVLGQGAYSVVRLARHVASGQLFALKEIPRTRLVDRTTMMQLTLEVNIHRRLRHPHVVRLYSYYETSEKMVLILEYCEKGTLMDLLRDTPHGRFDDRVAATFVRHISRGLQYLHEEHRIAHRDLKLENVLVDERGVAKLADFGWSRVIYMAEPPSRPVTATNTAAPSLEEQAGFSKGTDEDGGGRVSATLEKYYPKQRRRAGMEKVAAPAAEKAVASGRFTVCGTLDYLSPEMLSGVPHSKMTDVWSLGILVVEMLLGKPLFYHPSHAETMRCIREADVEAKLTEAVEDAQKECAASGAAPVHLSDGAQEFIRLLLQRRPEDRPEMREILEHSWLQKERRA